MPGVRQAARLSLAIRDWHGNQSSDPSQSCLLRIAAIEVFLPPAHRPSAASARDAVATFHISWSLKTFA
jgi:hypothetical protein